MASTLFPPIVEAWLPAFNKNAPLIVPYQVSPYNDNTNLNIEVSVRNSASNKTVLKSGRDYDEVIPDIKNKTFILPDCIWEQEDSTYKIQIRFKQSDYNKSEWSTVCLIKPITPPSVMLNLSDVLTSETLVIEGQASFISQSETLDSYTINVTSNDLSFTSPIIYTDEYNPNYIYYTPPIKLTSGERYNITINYTTRNGYSNSKSYSALVKISVDTKIEGVINTDINAEDGYIHVYGEILDNEFLEFKTLIILRSSSEDDFYLWEDLQYFVGKEIDYYDFTVKSGVFYKYAIQTYDPKTKIRSNMVIATDEEGNEKNTSVELEHTFLTSADMQFKVKYNPVINSYKRTISESKIETIGSQYPFIRRNAKVNYRQFSLTGTISWQSDLQGIFLNEDNVYVNSELYPAVRKKGTIYDSISEHELPIDERYDVINNYDYIFEREFREKILDFFYSEKPKLFRSTAEGNMIVKMMDVSLTPDTTLSRMIYNFSCNIIEIDECTVANYIKYQLINNNGELKDAPHVSIYEAPISQKIIDTRTIKNENIVNTILLDPYIGLIQGNKEIEIKNISYLHLIFIGVPQVYNCDGYLFNGYKVFINEQEILIPSQAYYVSAANDRLKAAFQKEVDINDYWIPSNNNHYHMGQYISASDTIITSIKFPDNASYKVYAQYESTLNVTIGAGTSLDGASNGFKYNYTYLPSQLRQLYVPNKDIIKSIMLRHIVSFDNYFYQLLNIDKIEIEAQPGTMYEFTYTDPETGVDTKIEDIIDMSGRYNINFPNSILNELKFTGIKLIKSPSDRSAIVSSDEFLDFTDELLTELPLYPVRNGVYNVNSQSYIYFNDEWCPTVINADEIILTDVAIPATINYVISALEGIQKEV